MVNAATLELLKSFEKLRLKSYDDRQPDVDITNPKTPIKGTVTCGFGHTGANVKRDTVCTEAQAEKWLTEDIRWAEDKVKKLCTAKLNENQRGALVDFTFNCGGGYLDRESHHYTPYKLWTAINNGVSERVIRDRWSTTALTSKGVVQNGLIRRRLAEIALYFEPVKK